MFYHIKIKYNAIDESGKNVVNNEEFLIQNCELHAEAEQKGFEYASEYQFENPDITHVKRSNIREFINETPDSDSDIIYDAVVADLFINPDNGKEK